MADENVPTPAPIRSDQILPFAAWVPIGKSNFVLDLQKKKRNLIFQISMDILHNTNFFRTFTALASVPAIYIQQFWNTLTYEAKTGAYHFQLDENWFKLDANLLREALEITPIDQAHQFESPPSGDAIMDFVNQLGFPGEIRFVSRMAVNNLYWPWRAILSMINQCITCKTFGFDWPRYPTFLNDKANLGIATKKDKKTKPHVIPYCHFTKLIICYLGRTYNIHQRSESLFNLAEDDLRLGNLKFIPKGVEDEVFGMPTEERGKKKSTSKANQSKKPKTAKQPKPVSSKQSKPAQERNLSSLQLVNEEEQAQPKPEPEPQVEGEEYDIERAIQMSLESFQEHGQASVRGVAFREPTSGIIQELPIVEGKGKGIATNEYVAQSLLELQKPKKTIRVNSSLADAETGTNWKKANSEAGTEVLKIDGEKGKEISNIMALEEKTTELDEGQARSDPCKTPESRRPPGESFKFTRDSFINENLDNFNFGDRFVNDNPTEEDPGKTNMETKVESMVTIPIHQASSSAHPLSTPVINSIPPKPISSPVQAPFIATSDTRDVPSRSSKQMSASQVVQPVDDIPILDVEHISNSEDICAAHLLKIKTRPDWLKPIPEEDGPKTPELDWVDWKSKLSKADLEGLAFKIDLVNPEGHRVVPDVSKPLPLRGPPGQLTVAHYLEFRLEELVQSLWIESEREYDISAAYDISHWWFKCKEFYITRHSAPSYCSTVRSHMRILSVFSLQTYSRYGYTFLKEFVLRRADYKEYKISEVDFKNLHLNDFKDLYLLYLQGKLNHLYVTDKPRAIIYKDRNDQKKMMREFEVHKFSDGTLQRILEKLDHMVKVFVLFKFNPSMENRIWSEDDRRRSKDFIEGRIKMEMELLRSRRVKFITACSYSTDTYQEIIRVQAKVSKLSQTLISTSSSVYLSDEVMK
nr:hypothetical protein [Tanacetum cinerariifolium]